jgi:peroxiredoxin
MAPIAASIALFVVCSGLASDLAGELQVHRFQGSLTPRRGESLEAVKTFQLTIVTHAGAPRGTTHWLLQEKLNGRLDWPDHLGTVQDAAGPTADSPGPALLLERPDGKFIVPLLWPQLGSDCPLRDQGSWQDGKLEYQVVGREQKGDSQLWRVEARSGLGLRRRMLVDSNDRIVRHSQETVFIGQGEEFELVYQLQRSEPIPAGESRESLERGFSALHELRDRLQRPPRSVDLPWTVAQLTMIREQKSTLAPWREHAVLGPVVQSIEQESRRERDRAGALATLREKAIGKEQSLFGLKDAQAKPIALDQLAGQVVVLHFWEYKDAPLVEPYGQVGYVDFLYRKPRDGKLRVFGVVVDSRWADESTRRPVIASAQKLTNFMNLSYPLLFDDGKVLQQFGDPRPAGSKLPLFVVIGRDGKIVEYHAGPYEVTRDRGIEELEKIVTKAMGPGE